MATGNMASAACGFAWLLTAVMLMLASWFDMRWRRIPNWLTVAAAFGGLAIALIQGALLCALFAVLLSMLVTSLPNLFKSGAIGPGDIKLVGAVGALLGIASTLFTIGAASGAALAYAISIGRLRRSRNRHSALPFAPFLLAGFLLATRDGLWPI